MRDRYMQHREVTARTIRDANGGRSPYPISRIVGDEWLHPDGSITPMTDTPTQPEADAREVIARCLEGTAEPLNDADAIIAALTAAGLSISRPAHSMVAISESDAVDISHILCELAFAVHSARQSRLQGIRDRLDDAIIAAADPQEEGEPT